MSSSQGKPDTTTSTVSFRMNQTLKSQFEETCEDMGINMSSAFNLFAKQVVAQQQIPFVIKVGSPYKKMLLERIANIEAGKNTTGPFGSMETLWQSLTEGIDDEI
jgi:DNA-damage-inducible protein J